MSSQSSEQGEILNQESPSVGQTLKTAREGKELSLKEVERATRIRGKNLLAIEADDYASLPNDVYTRGFVQTYARFLELDDTKIVDAYTRQRGHADVQLKRPSRLQSSRLALTPRVLTLIGSLLAVAAVAVYLIWQFSSLTAPPNLQVTNPSKDQVLYGSLITVSGHVAGGADVFVNDSPILVDGNGNFTDDIALQDGVNSINVTAKSHLGKTTTVTRNILAHVPKTDPASALPAAPFDGVAVAVSVQQSATTVTVTIDGKRTFRGTMLPGTVLTFKGANTVKVDTSNAGATSLTVTNSTAANKSLGTLGPSGQPKTDFEFDKDTQFQ